MPERSGCAGAQNQRLPFPLLSDAGELLRKNFDIKARDAPCSLPPSLPLAFYSLIALSGGAYCGLRYECLHADQAEGRESLGVL